MEPQHISSHLPAKQHPATPSLKISDEQATLEAVAATEKLATCSEKDLIIALAACYILTSLRLDNRPDKDQAALLRDFIRTSFGGNSLAEMKFAFNMAV